MHNDQPLTETEAQAAVAIALMTALADGRTSDQEREHIRSLFATFGDEAGSLAEVHHRVLLRRTTLEAECGKLTSAHAKQTAFEMAVCVAEIDGPLSPVEREMLDRLEGLLGLDHAAAVGFEREAERVASASPDDQVLDAAALLGPMPAAAVAAGAAGAVDARGKEADSIIMTYSILNGALELLPQSLATMAILPLQTRMVYAIGKQYGHALGAGHIKEFIATLGLGATSQMLENFARKTLGGLAKKALGKTAGRLVSAATGPMMTFASTYAIGQVAKAYYAGGRTLSAIDLRSMFQRDLARGKQLYEQHRGTIERSASTLRPAAVLDLVRGKMPG